jgi:hypothetical protein
VIDGLDGLVEVGECFCSFVLALEDVLPAFLPGFEVFDELWHVSVNFLQGGICCHSYSLNHVICSFKVCQHDTNIGLVIGPLSKGAETPLHGLHCEQLWLFVVSVV